jgi:hypothetical protein
MKKLTVQTMSVDRTAAKMSLNIVSTLRSKPAHEAARLIGIATQYITDDNFINLLNQYELNRNSNNRIAEQNDRRLEQQFSMFAATPQLRNQVEKWLSR